MDLDRFKDNGETAFSSTFSRAPFERGGGLAFDPNTPAMSQGCWWDECPSLATWVSRYKGGDSIFHKLPG